MNPMPRFLDAVPLVRRLFSLALLLCCGLALPLSAAEPRVKFNVPAGEAGQTLKLFAQQAGREIMFAAKPVENVRTNAVRGTLTPTEAIDLLLNDTGLVATVDAKTGAFAVRLETPDETKNGASRRAEATTASGGARVEGGTVKLETFEVMGSRLLNMDLPRSRDDALPYVVFDRQAITNSGATNLEEFFRQRVSMESTALSESQTTSNLGGRSTVNLRGMGAGQTLILVDGHRMSGVVSVGSPSQPDLNGIPLSAIERIEILPTSAGAIYGGNATGGVVNIILRRDYSGLELKLTYGNTFKTDAATRQIDLSAGFSLFEGKTNVLIAASASDANLLLAQDRDFRERGVAQILANNPAVITGQTVPPVGSTSNIRSTNGQNLVLANGNVPLNSPITFVPLGYAGPSTDNGAAFVANAGRYNLDNAQTVTGGQRALLNAPQRESLMVTVRHEFSDTFQAFLELNGSNSTSRYPSANSTSFVLPGNATNPNNPFVQQIRITTPYYGVNDLEAFTSSKDRRAVGGVIVQLPGEWKGEVDYAWHQATLLNQRTVMSATGQAAATAAVTGGTLNLLRDTMAFPVDFRSYFDAIEGGLPSRSISRTITARAAGPLGHLPAGRPILSALAEQRDQEYGGPGSGTALPQTQRVKSAYMETKLPIVSADFGWSLVRELEFHVAARWDDYTTNGQGIATPFGPPGSGTNQFDSINPSAGLRWVINPNLMVRASYGTGFLPPNVNNIAPTSFPGFPGFYQDPRRGNEPVGFYDEVFGGNPNLKPERSKTWSAGVVFTPETIAGLRLSVDWTRIEKTDNFGSPDVFQMLANEAAFPGRIVRGPVPPGDPYGVGPIIEINTSLMNLALANIETVDFSLDYTRDTTAGRFDFFAVATYAVAFETQIQAGAPIIDNVGRGNSAQSAAGGGAFPLRWRGNAGVTWTRGPLQVGWSMRYIDDYVLNSFSAATILAQGNGGRVDAQIYHDVFVSYDFRRRETTGWWAPLLADTQLRLTVRNVLNTEPPFDASNTANYYSGFGDPRLANYSLSLTRRF